MSISTISTKDLIPEATRAIERYTRRSDPNVTLSKYSSHLSTEDLVMATVEKVLRANPLYLTKTYVWLAAKSVCINESQKKRFILTESSLPENECPPLEESIEGVAFDDTSDLYKDLLTHLTEDEQILLSHLIQGTLYAEIAETLGLSLRTLERRVAELKWKTEFLVTEENPDEVPLVY